MSASAATRFTRLLLLTTVLQRILCDARCFFEPPGPFTVAGVETRYATVPDYNVHSAYITQTLVSRNGCDQSGLTLQI